MPATRRRRAVPRLGTKSRVHRITNIKNWERTHAAAKNRMVFVLFAAEFAPNTMRLKQFVAEMSQQTNFKDAEFLYVDVERAPGLSEEHGITSEELPVFACYRNGELLEKYPVDQKIEGILAHKMFTMFSRHTANAAAENAQLAKPGLSRVVQLALGALTVGAVVIAAAAVAISRTLADGGRTAREAPQRQKQRSGGEASQASGDDGDSELISEFESDEEEEDLERSWFEEYEEGDFDDEEDEV
ncbi:unnamed protein product [Ostreobium quekettii]|uniref:Thioredoxin domain-containing protein n=1 Tax=Ostreobium quekettii TaxID=121088 RepID=A0A8S1IWF0_9CHLO|nr:unnamed protein product [Ostreobium quekettii]|eukprot:evm.model.scf_59.12 EVM.evm.TU.scf_59.12   scf_59:75418-79984(+)